MENGEHDFDGRFLLRFVHVHRNAATVINDSNRIANMDDDVNVFAVPGQCFVNGVIHDLVHEMVQPALAGIANVHRRTFAHRLDAFQFLDLVGGIFLSTSYGFYVF